MKDIGKANFLNLITLITLYQNHTSQLSKISINVITRNTGVLRNHTNDIKFLMKHLLCLEED